MFKVLDLSTRGVLNPGILKLFAWSKDFNPNIQQNSSAQVWLRIYGLAQEYWHPKILFAIASSVGTPICTDQLTNKPRFEREFGHFARVLVDMDLKKEPLYRVLVGRELALLFLLTLSLRTCQSIAIFVTLLVTTKVTVRELFLTRRKWTRKVT
jgi:hypothetical protein